MSRTRTGRYRPASERTKQICATEGRTRIENAVNPWRDIAAARPGRVKKNPMFFDELNNDEWALIAPLVADEPAVRLNRRGRPRAEPRIVTNAVLWILTTGEPGSELPGRLPSGPPCR